MRDRCKWLRDAEILKSNANQEKADPPNRRRLDRSRKMEEDFLSYLEKAEEKNRNSRPENNPECNLPAGVFF